MTERILFVDDEPMVLSGIKRVLHRSYELDTAEGGEAGLALLDQHDYAVVVSDMRMPHMSGEEFLARAHEVQPDAIQVILSGQASLEATIEAVNRGEIFRFLLKPASPETMQSTIDQALRQYRLVHAERDLLEQTLGGAVAALTEVVEMISPAASQRTSLVTTVVDHITSQVEILPAWPLRLAAMLSGVGFASVPSEVLERAGRGRELDETESAMLAKHTDVVSQLLGKIPRLDGVTSIIRAQAGAEAVPPMFERHVAALDIAVNVAHGILRGATCDSVIAKLTRLGRTDPELLAAFAMMPLDDGSEVKDVVFDDLEAGMTLRSDVETKQGVVLAASGTVISEAMLTRFTNFAMSVGLQESFLVSDPNTENEVRSLDIDLADAARGHLSLKAMREHAKLIYS